MSDSCPTIKVKYLGHDDLDHIIINEADFDEAVHKRLSAAELKKLEKAEQEEAESASDEPGADDAA